MANKTQRRVNRTIRKLEKVLRTDPYLQNRFWIKQIQASKEDGMWYFRFEIKDTVTNTKKETDWYAEYEVEYNMTSRMFNFFNDFIIKKLHKYGE